MKSQDDSVREYLKAIGSKGGKARAKKLSKKELSRIGKMGGRPKLDRQVKMTPNGKSVEKSLTS